MLSKEEIEKAKEFINNIKKTIQENNMLFGEENITIKVGKTTVQNIDTLLQYIDQLEQENKALKKGQTSLMSSRKKWRNRYYNLKSKNKEDTEGWKSVLDCAKFEINKREQEKDKANKVIDEMAEYLVQDIRCIRPEIECDKIRACIKQYFEKKVGV